MKELMRDAAYASNLKGWTGAVAGYFGGPSAFHVWSPSDWAQFKGLRKLPIWVGGQDGAGEGWAAAQALWALGVPKGVYTVLDMEGRTDKTYVTNYGAVLNFVGYAVWVYGSANTVFTNPRLNGYWVADYTGTGPFMFPGARATQYTNGQTYDSSTVKTWTYYFGNWWK